MFQFVMEGGGWGGALGVGIGKISMATVTEHCSSFVLAFEKEWDIGSEVVFVFRR